MSSRYEFIDIGAGDGVMVFLALCSGAILSIGIEFKGEQESCFLGYMPILEKHGGSYQSVCGMYGRDATSFSSLPSLQHDDQEYFIPRVVYCFCDGWHQLDRKHVFSELAGKDPLVKLVLCSPGKAGGDWFSNAASIARALNESNIGCKFVYHSVIKVHMVGSGSQKQVFVFNRT